MRHWFVIALAVALVTVVSCDQTENTQEMCPQGFERAVDRCVPSGGLVGASRPGCLDNDAANFTLDATEDDGSCLYNVSFQVDVSGETVGTGEVVYLRGSFNGFDPTATPMTDDNGDAVWTATLALAPGAYEYKYAINDVTAGGVDEVVPRACDFMPNDEFANRGFALARAPLSLRRHPFGACASPFAPITFDDPGVTYTLTGFAGAEDSTVVADPGGGSNQVVRVVKSASAELYAGTTVSTGANNSISRIPFDAANTRLTVRVLSPDAGIQVRLKVEDAADPTRSVETEATTTMAGAFEVLTFDFTNQVAGTAALNFGFTYNKATIFFNFGVTGAIAGEKVYHFDDVAFLGGGGGGGGGGFTPITFDDAAVTYTLTGFAGAEDSTVVADPGGGSNQVVRVVKSASAELYAGTTVSIGPNASIPRIPFDAANTRLTVRVLSPDAGIQVRLKVEDAADPTRSVETEATTTMAGAFEVLTFDFTNQAAGTAALNLGYTYNKATIFFNFGVTGAIAGEKVYHFDDLAFLR